MLFWCLSFASALGCEGSTDERGGAGGPERGGVALQISPGVNVTSATYAISGPGGFTTTGTLAVGATANVIVNITGLPVGSGYTVNVAAVASDGMTTCTGSANFNVTSPPMTAPVAVHLTCGPGGIAGVTESTDVCPILDGIDASPAGVRVGGSVALTATAHDLDGGPGAITFTWTATGGSLSDASSATPTFTCTAPGTFTLTVAIADGNPACVDSLSVDVTCTVP
jgi:PKD domain